MPGSLLGNRVHVIHGHRKVGGALRVQPLYHECDHEG